MRNPALALLAGILAVHAGCDDGAPAPAPRVRPPASPATRALIEHAVAGAGARYGEVRRQAEVRAAAEAQVTRNSLNADLADVTASAGILSMLGSADAPGSVIGGIVGGPGDPDRLLGGSIGGVAGGTIGGGTGVLGGTGAPDLHLSLDSVDDGVDGAEAALLTRQLHREARRCLRSSASSLPDARTRRRLVIRGLGGDRTQLTDDLDDALSACLERLALRADLPADATITFDLTTTP